MAQEAPEEATAQPPGHGHRARESDAERFYASSQAPLTYPHRDEQNETGNSSAVAIITLPSSPARFEYQIGNGTPK